MTKIVLHADFAPLVIDGRKVTTARHGKRDYALGDAVFDVGGVELPINIHQLRYVRFDALDDVDAQLDGFANVNELRHALLRFYPNATGDDVVTIVHFTYTGRHHA